MATYDTALESAKMRAQRNDTTYFIYHQPEAWEDRDTGWHVVDATEYYHGFTVIDENTVRCSVTWDDEVTDYSVKQFEPSYDSTWQEG